MLQKWEQDYSTFKLDFESLQGEIHQFVKNLSEEQDTKIDIANVYPRKGVKNFESIEKNYKNNHYKDKSCLLNLEDIAGIRVICHCEDDVYALEQRLIGELQQRQYLEIKKKSGEDREYPYRATHITFAKKIKKDEKTYQIFCEIQIRTVMADAWAIQNHKYLYKRIEEGETNELTSAVSEIMNGCEKLWSLVKKKSAGYQKDYIEKAVQTIRKKSDFKLKSVAPNIHLKKWFESHREKATRGLQNLGVITFMEVEIQPLLDSNFNCNKNQLREGAMKSTTRTFGWPIGVFLDNSPYAPKSDPLGIYAEISVDKDNAIMGQISYDYWAIHSGGSFYLKKSLFEDQRKPDQIFFNTRIIRITEVFMYIKNLYSYFDIPMNTSIRVMIKHGGLNGRILSSSSPDHRPLFHQYKTETDEVFENINVTLEEIENNITDIVEKFTSSLFEQFDFFKLKKTTLNKIVSKYSQGILS